MNFSGTFHPLPYLSIQKLPCCSGKATYLVNLGSWVGSRASPVFWMILKTEVRPSYDLLVGLKALTQPPPPYLPMQTEYRNDPKFSDR